MRGIRPRASTVPAFPRSVGFVLIFNRAFTAFPRVFTAFPRVFTAPQCLNSVRRVPTGPSSLYASGVAPSGARSVLPAADLADLDEDEDEDDDDDDDLDDDEDDDEDDDDDLDLVEDEDDEDEDDDDDMPAADLLGFASHSRQASDLSHHCVVVCRRVVPPFP